MCLFVFLSLLCCVVSGECLWRLSETLYSLRLSTVTRISVLCVENSWFCIICLCWYDFFCVRVCCASLGGLSLLGLCFSFFLGFSRLFFSLLLVFFVFVLRLLGFSLTVFRVVFMFYLYLLASLGWLLVFLFCANACKRFDLILFPCFLVCLFSVVCLSCFLSVPA